MSGIILSILIPAYNFPNGIRRILERLEYNSETEIVIFDNSDNLNILQLIDRFKKKFNNQIVYKSFNATNAVQNWNNLIKFSNGNFYILLHHDELLLLNTTMSNFVNYLKNTESSLLIFKCILKKRFLKLHFPIFLSKFLVKRFPIYLLKRNFLGPTACLVIKKDVFYELYDENLKWLVDVDFYYRLFLNKNIKFEFSNLANIYSFQDNTESITNKLKLNFNTTYKFETKFIIKKYNFTSIFYLYKFDFILWFLFKIIFLPFSFLISLNSQKNNDHW